MEMVDSQSCSSSNRASMDGTSDEKEEKEESLDGPLSLFLLICLINLGSFSHLCTHDICC